MPKKVVFILLLVLMALATFWFWPKAETAVALADKPQLEAITAPQGRGIADVG